MVLSLSLPLIGSWVSEAGSFQDPHLSFSSACDRWDGLCLPFQGWIKAPTREWSGLAWECCFCFDAVSHPPGSPLLDPVRGARGCAPGNAGLEREEA